MKLIRLIQKYSIHITIPFIVAILSACGGNDSEEDKNPCAASIATSDVRDTEAVAAQLVAAAEIVQLKSTITTRWRTALTQRLGALSEEEIKQLGTAVDELVFVYAQRAANGDPARPKISWTEAPPHAWGGTQVSGSRYAGDNPDNVYRLAPVDNVSSYEIIGKVNASAPTEFLIQVTDSGDAVIGTDEISLRTLKIEADGSFKITVSPLPANGASNHLQTGSKSTELFIRDTMADWNSETPLTLSIRRLSGPDSQAKTFAEMVQKTVSTSNTWASNWLNSFILRSLFASDANTIPQPMTGTGNISRTGANFQLGDDEAIVITVNSGSATYTGLTVQNIWGITPDYWNAQSSLTNKQALPNLDGTFTYVLSPTDPGVHNWISTAGTTRGTLYQRWQGAALPASPVTAYVRTQVAKLSGLRDVLPAETKFVTSSERAAQLAARQQAFARRVQACN